MSATPPAAASVWRYPRTDASVPPATPASGAVMDERKRDGLVALPTDARTKEQLEWLADEVIEAGGEATVWLARPGSVRQERAMAARMADAVAADYRGVAADAAGARRDADGATRRRTLGRLRRELRRIERRDFFPPPERERARPSR